MPMRLGLAAACKSQCHPFRWKDLELYNKCVRLKLPGSDVANYLVDCAYFPPSSNVHVFTSYFRTLLDRIEFSKDKAHIYGDFNLPKVDWCTGLTGSECALVREKAGFFVDLVNYNGFCPHNVTPDCAESVLDLFL